MFQLTREVRFAVTPQDDGQLLSRPTNNHGGHPSLRGFGVYLALQLTLSGELNPASNYLVNIKQIDSTARERAIPLVTQAIRGPSIRSPERVVQQLHESLKGAWEPLELLVIRVSLSPFLSYEAFARELPMVRLSQKFEFSATHRLHNPALSDEENCRTFGKCNNPHGHGHNYEVQVTLAGIPKENGVLIDVPSFESIVARAVIERFDHKNLNVEVAEFSDLIPTVENIARVIYRLLKPRFELGNASLQSVTVWETPKTWCQYSE